MKPIITLSIFLCSLTGFCQDKILINEGFDDNSGNWSLADREEYGRKISDGKLIMTHRAKNYHWCGQKVVLEKKKNMKIETEISVTNYKSGQVGIIWGGSDDNEKICFFMISPGGTFNYGIWDPLFQSLTGSLRSDAIKKGIATNKLTVKKDGGRLRLYVNDVEVHSAKFPSGYGMNVGLVNGGGSIVAEADYLSVTELAREKD
jgi:hypothetical protein